MLASGGVKCWGDNRKGQLGDGTTTLNVSGEDEPSGAEEDLPAPDPAEVGRWWAGARRRLDPAVRLLRGSPWSAAGLLDALERGPMRRREALALDLAIRTRGQSQVTWNARTADQRAQLAQARAGVTKISARGYGS